jgi:hypothetical protein
MSNSKQTYSFYEGLAKLKGKYFKEDLKKMYKEQGRTTKNARKKRT